MNKKYKLSIIVPTRERSDTLYHTIKTIVEQKYESFEIIISDNISNDNTKSVVELFNDQRIIYINTGKRISMTDNWEYALEHVKGEYITYIGDDDGFIPGAISKAMGILEMSKMNAIIWDKADYCWPDHIDMNMRNTISFRIRNSNTQIGDGYKRLKEVIKFKSAYTRLPCLYNGIISTQIIRKIKELSKNRMFFNAISPDVYSGIVISMFVGNYLIVDYPLSISGASRHSNGTSFMRVNEYNTYTPASIFMSENKRNYDSRIMLGPSASIAVMGEYLFSKEYLPNIKSPKPEWKRYIHKLLEETRFSYQPEYLYQCARHTADILNIKIDKLNKNEVNNNIILGVNNNKITFKVPPEKINNVYDASLLIAGMLPDTIGDKYKSPLKTFMLKTIDNIISEIKILYRTI